MTARAAYLYINVRGFMAFGVPLHSFTGANICTASLS